MPIKVANSMEDIVKDFLDDLLEQYPEVCKCNQCRVDIASFALNRLPPKYTTSSFGEVYTKSSLLDCQYRADIISALTKGIKSVKNNPRHTMQEK